MNLRRRKRAAGKIYDVRVVGEKNELLKLVGITLLDLGKLLFVGVLVDRFFNASQFAQSFGFGLTFWLVITAALLGFGFLTVRLSIKGKV